MEEMPLGFKLMCVLQDENFTNIHHAAVDYSLHDSHHGLVSVAITSRHSRQAIEKIILALNDSSRRVAREHNLSLGPAGKAFFPIHYPEDNRIFIEFHEVTPKHLSDMLYSRLNEDHGLDMRLKETQDGGQGFVFSRRNGRLISEGVEDDAKAHLNHLLTLVNYIVPSNHRLNASASLQKRGKELHVVFEKKL